MSDLAQKVCEAADLAVDSDPLKLRNVIFAVVQAHSPWESEPARGHCSRCGQPVPCFTVRAVAGALGVREDLED